MGHELSFLSEEQVIQLHADAIEDHGGRGGIRDLGLLQAAVMTPRSGFGDQYFHESVPAMAAAYMFHLAQNHPFHDGNKRVAFAAAVAFLYGCGYRLETQEPEASTITLAVASGAMSKAQLTVWFESHAKK